MNNNKLVRAAVFTAAIAAGILSRAEAQQQIVPEAIVGIDNIPLAVNDLELAITTYRTLGFAIKPGPERPNGLRTGLIEFPDGSGIELIAVPEAVDELTTTYRQLLDTAEGPAFFGLHARDMNQLTTALRTERMEFTEEDGILALASRIFDYLFFNRDNSSITDNSAYFAHRNGTTAMSRVWIAPDRSADLQQLLVALGGEATSRTVYTPGRASARVVAVTNGEIVILPKSYQVTKNRPVVGATFNVSNISVMETRLTTAGIPFTKGGTENMSLVVAPSATHGMWLEFRE